MADKRLTLPAEQWVSEDGVVYVAIRDNGDFLATASNRRAAEAKRMLRATVMDVLRAEELRDRNHSRRLIVTKEGTVLLVEYREGWRYSITRAGSDHAGVCMFPDGATFEGTVALAEEHAKSAFDGVAFEAPI